MSKPLERVNPENPGDGSGTGRSPPYAALPERDRPPLLDAAADHCSVLLWRGIAAIAFAVLAFFWPGLSLLGLTILWGTYSFVDGVLALTAAFRARVGATRAWLSLIGVAGIACAGAVLIAPAAVADRLVAIVAAWAIFTGAMQVWISLVLRRVVDGGWLLTLDGVGAILLGLALILGPRLELAATVWLTGWFAALLGSLFVYVSLWLDKPL